MRATPATADTTPATIGVEFEAPGVGVGGTASMAAAGDGAGVGAVFGGAGVVVAGGEDDGGEPGAASPAGAVAGVAVRAGEGAWETAGVGASVLVESAANAVVSSITATRSPCPRFVSAHDPYVVPAMRIFPSDPAAIACRWSEEDVPFDGPGPSCEGQHTTIYTGCSRTRRHARNTYESCTWNSRDNRFPNIIRRLLYTMEVHQVSAFGGSSLKELCTNSKSIVSHPIIDFGGKQKIATHVYPMNHQTPMHGLIISVQVKILQHAHKEGSPRRFFY